MGNGLLYLGSMVFNKTSDGTQLESIAWDGGRIVAEPDGWGGTNLVPYLYSTDHLGSIRAVRNALTGAVVSRSDYEPYGAHTTLSGTPQRYRYNAKEDQSFAGTPYLDYGARQYDPAIGRWMAPDPLAEKCFALSPYSFCVDNPICFLDNDGYDWYRYQDNDGTHYSYTESHSQADLEDSGISNGQYLGEAIVVFSGRIDERIGSNKTMKDADAIPAVVTIYGLNGADGIITYSSGLSITSDDTKYPKIKEGEYKMFHQQMATSAYGKGSLTYRIKTLDNSLDLPSADTDRLLTEVFFHRTNNDGNASRSSVACLVIDGRDWKSVEKQLGYSHHIYLILT